MKKEELLKGIKNVIFDMDGTLIDSLSMWSDIDVRFFQEHHMEVPKDYDKRIAHMNFMEMAQFTKDEYGFEESVEEIAFMWTSWAQEAYEKTLLAKPGAKEFLAYCKSKGMQISLATTNKRELYEPCLENNNMWQYFDFCMNVNEIGSTKSEPKIYLLLAEKMGSKPEETMVFEDILQAVKTAKNAGFKVTAVYDKRNEADLEEIKDNCDYFLESYETLE